MGKTINKAQVIKILKGLGLLILLIWTLFPIYWMTSIAIRGHEEFSSSLSIIPKSITFENFINLFEKKNFMVAVNNSLEITLISIVFSLAFGFCCAYILARERYKFKAKGVMLLWVLLVRILPPIALALPLYIFMTSWNEYLYGAIFVQSPSNFTIPLSLATLNSEQELTQWGSIMAGGIISLIPIALFVGFAQNFLIQGLSSGAVKE